MLQGVPLSLLASLEIAEKVLSSALSLVGEFSDKVFLMAGRGHCLQHARSALNAPLKDSLVCQAGVTLNSFHRALCQVTDLLMKVR